VGIVFSAAVLGGASCDPSGARFSPTTGVLTYKGTDAGDLVTASVSGGAIVLNGGQIPIQGGVPTVANTVRIVLMGRGGNDYLAIDESGGALPPVRLFGDAGADVLIGGSSKDEVHGGPGTDVALLGDGDDTFFWSPGDELDTVEGEEGFDKFVFHGDDADEIVDVYATGGRARLFRNVETVTTDLGGVEALDYFARGGADRVYVHDLAGTALTRVRVDLAGANGAADGQIDQVQIVGTNGWDTMELVDAADGILTTGLQADVEIQGQDAEDLLVMAALAENDVIYSQVAAGAIRTRFEGGLGDDILVGGPGDEEFIGGDGEDSLMMGGGDDTLVWNPGDDSDLVDGEEGFDTMRFHGANVSETFDISALGGKVRLFRSVANVTMELDDVEAIDLPVRGGADLVRVNDLSGTELVEVNVDLAAVASGGDLSPDHVVVHGTPGDDSVQVFGDASLVWVVGLATQVTIASLDGPNDALTLLLFAGEDVMQASSLTASGPTLTADGGDHADVLIGGAGADVLLGGEGDDVLQGGPGLDVLDGGPGDNIVIQ
jgi:Ca2+-binding RTX toxin-like protein